MSTMHACSFRFENWWIHPIHATIMDYNLLRTIDIFPEIIGEPEFELWCQYCGSTDCEHVEFAKTVPEIIERLRKAWTEAQIEGKQNEEIAALKELQKMTKQGEEIEYRRGYFTVKPSKK